MAIIEDARFVAIFAPGSRAEVPIVGRLDHAGKEIRVSGQVDRLVVTDDAILIADYKSDRAPPQALDTDNPYVAQLALYRAVLTRLYPDKAVRAALLFTAVPDLREVPAATMDAALQAALARASRHSDRAAGKVP